MPDTIRSLSDLQTLLADNTAGNISAQDIRDFLVSVDPENAIITNTLSNLPSLTKKGFLFLPSDASSLFFDNLSAFKQFGPISPLKQPIIGDFSWVNQGTATATTANGGITLGIVSPSAGINLRCQVKTIPSHPYTVSAAFYYATVNTGNAQGALTLRQSSDGKIIQFQVNQAGVVGSSKWNSSTAFSANYAINVPLTSSGLHYLRITDDSTNRKFYYSHNGVDWIEVFSVSRTDFITPDQIGFNINCENGRTAYLHLLHWEESP